jgi:hypothetical protein
LRRVTASYRFQIEKLSSLRPPWTSWATSHDAGASLLYFGHTVWFEWQS